MTARKRFTDDEKALIGLRGVVEVLTDRHWYLARIISGIHKDTVSKEWVSTVLSSGPHSGDYVRAYPGHIRTPKISKQDAKTSKQVAAT